MLELLSACNLRSTIFRLLLVAILSALLIFTLISLLEKSSHLNNMVQKFGYPVARRDETIVNDFNGTQVCKQCAACC